VIKLKRVGFIKSNPPQKMKPWRRKT